MTMQDDRNLLVFTGNANRPLANEVCRQLGVRPGRALVGRFSDGEVQVEIEENVRAQDVFVLHATCAPSAVNLVEWLILSDALITEMLRQKKVAEPTDGQFDEIEEIDGDEDEDPTPETKH